MKIIVHFLITTFVITGEILGQTGSIAGKLTDKKSGDPLMFANIFLKKGGQLVTGGTTDMEGKYQLLNVKQGTYEIEARYIGYTPKRVTDVAIKVNEVAYIDFFLEDEASSTEVTTTVVSVKKMKNSENALLNEQKKSEVIQDGISSQEMSRNGTNNAASAMSKVTGATVVGGKYVYVRGLGDRYSNAQLNGQNLSGTDPYRNSTQLDLIPANLLDNIITSKTFTPDQPGNFTGGNINITTKSFPNKLILSFSTTASYNTQSSFNKHFITMNQGKYDWLGYDDGTRAIPEILNDPANNEHMVSDLYIKARKNPEMAGLLDETSKSLSPVMVPSFKNSFIDHGFSFSAGNQIKLGKRPFGFVFGLNYKRDYTFYENGTSANWELTDKNAEELNNSFRFTDTKGVENPQIGALMNLAYKYSGHGEISVNTVYNHNADIISQFQTGKYPGVISNSDNIFNTRTLQFIERELSNIQVNGKHIFVPSSRKIKFEWSGSYSVSSQDEPDLRFFANDQSSDNSNYYISPSEYDLPFHFFRYLKDDQLQGKIDITVPILQKKSKSNKIKFGAYSSDKNRSFTERRFQLKRDKGELYAGDPEAYFNPENVGIVGYDSLRGRNIIGVYATDESKDQNNYTGSEKISAAYLMATMDLTKKLKFIGGARAENTNIYVVSKDTSLPAGNIRQSDFLPSVNLIYALTGKMNLRATYSHTLARPNMRELAPFASFDFIGGWVYLGNPELDRTLVNNYDFRWEFYPAAGEIIAISSYYKSFKDPIIKRFSPQAANPEIRFENVNQANVMGLELEIRKNLNILFPELKNFKAGVNVSVIKSEVDIEEGEYGIINSRNQEFGKTRPFQGQSPFIVNANLIYNNDSIRLESILSFNVFGKRLSEVGSSGTPDIYEQSRNMLDFSISKNFFKNISVRFMVRNILNATYKKTLSYKNQEFVYQSYRLGRTFSLGVSYNLQ